MLSTWQKRNQWARRASRSFSKSEAIAIPIIGAQWYGQSVLTSIFNMNDVPPRKVISAKSLYTYVLQTYVLVC